MVKRSRTYTVVMLLLIGAGIAFGQLSPSLIQQKLHPTFQAVVASDGPGLLAKFGGGPTATSGKLTNGKVVFNAIITTTNPDAIRGKGIHLNSVFNKYATAQVTKEDLLNLVQLDEVQFVDPGSINYPQLDLSRPETGANLLHDGFLNKTPYKGKGVIVLIYDTGIDWKDLDFRDPVDTTKSRILYIWDQTLTPQAGEVSPTLSAKSSPYGVEYTKAQIEREIGGTPANFVREKDINGHGTHVAGIAAGNGNSYFGKYVGMAPEADIIVVKGGDGSFSEVNMMDGLTYAANKASQLGEPIALNWSIGGQAGPHNGNRPYEVAVDSFVSTPGRVVAISAGNDGANVIHTSGTVTPGQTTTISVTVPSYTPTPGTENDTFELDVWFAGPVGLTAKATSPTPNSITISESANSSGIASNAADGTIELYNTSSTLTNGGTLVQLYVHDKTASVPKTGTWTLTFSNANGSSSFNAWLSATTVGSSSVIINGGDTQETVAMPGTARGAITVGSYITKNAWPSFTGSAYQYTGTVTVGTLSSFSSTGPTGDGRQKPDIAAPGQGIGSSLSSMVPGTDSVFTLPGMKDIVDQGTSMAAPHVTGASALLLQISPGLTAAQVKTLLTSTATADAATGTSLPNMQYGWGKLDILRAAAKAFNPASTVQRVTFAYEVDGSNQVFVMTGSTKYAVRFTPNVSGLVAGMQVNLTTAANRSIEGTGPLVCEIWSNTSGSLGGIPGTKLGSSVLYPFVKLSTATNNYIDMIAAGVNVTAGQDYHLVISLSSPKDTIVPRSDLPPTSQNRSSSYDGVSWKNLLERSSSTAANLRMRAVVVSSTGLVFVENTGSVPREFQLAQNYPNPFNPSTTIRYSVPVQSQIRLRVFDIIGREVALLVDQQQSPGDYAVNWRGTNNVGVPLSSGVYFYRLEGAGHQLTKKMILLK